MVLVLSDVMDSEKLLSIDFEISSTCQAVCPVCSRTTDGKLQEFKQVTKTLSEVQNILGDLVPQLQMMTFCGNYGDTMACTEIVEICQWLLSENPKLRIDIATNGGIGKPEAYAGLGKLGVNIVFGLDGTDEKTNQLYRVNVKWKNVMDNLSAYSETSVAEHSSWQFLLFNENKNHLEDAIKMAIKYRLKEMFINEWPNPFSRHLHFTLEDDKVFFSDKQKLPVYNIGGIRTHTLTPAYDMPEKVRELKEKYGTDLLFI